MIEILSNTVNVTVQNQGNSNGYSLSVYVFNNSSGSPISGASVTVQGQTLLTNNNGNVTFTNLSAGNTIITVSASGYNTATETINIQGNTTIQIPLTSNTTPPPNCYYVVNTTVTGGGYVTPSLATITGSQQFTAIAFAGYRFVSWDLIYGSTTTFLGYENPITISASDLNASNIPCNSTVTLKANFLKLTIFELESYITY